MSPIQYSNTFVLCSCIFQVDNENDILPYWLSNTSALLCLLQRNLRSNGFLTTPSRRSAGSLGLSGRIVQVSELSILSKLVIWLAYMRFFTCVLMNWCLNLSSIPTL